MRRFLWFIFILCSTGTALHAQCPPGQFQDCSGNCWPVALLEHLDDWVCNNGVWNAGSYSYAPAALNLDCDLFDFDGGDCVTRGCTDPLAVNYYEFATQDDGSCNYGVCFPGAEDCMGNCIPEDWIGQNACTGDEDDPLSYLGQGAYPDKLLVNIGVGVNPRGMCVLPDGSKAYVASGGTVTVIDILDLSGCASTSSIGVGGLAYSCSSSADGTLVFVANWSLSQVQVIDTSTDEIIASIPVGANPLKMWTAHNGEHVFVSCHEDESVYMIKVSTLLVAHIFATGTNPRNICTSPSDDKLYVANWGSATMSAFQTVAPFDLVATVPVDYWPQAIWASPDDDYVLVANFGFDHSYDHCSVIRTEDWQVVARLQTGAGPEDMVSIGEDGQYLYVSNWGMQCCFNGSASGCCSGEVNKGSVTVIALPDFDVLVPPGTLPDEVPYIQSTLKTIPLEAEYSFGMAVHPSGQYIYTVNKDSHSMSVIGLFSLLAALPGETCATALEIGTLNGCIEASTTCYTDEYNESCPFTTTGGRDIVYKYSPTHVVEGSIDLCSSLYDTKVYIYEDGCGDYNSDEAMYCNDDFCGTNGWRSYLGDVVLYPGSTYYLVVDGFGTGDHGDFSMCLSFQCRYDLNDDGLIGLEDMLEFIAGYGTVFSAGDLSVFLAEYGSPCEP